MPNQDGGKDIYKPQDFEKSALGYMSSRYQQEAAFDRISNKEWTAFAKGMTTIYSIVFNQEKPDVIIAPSRGAAYLLWALELMSEKTGQQMPDVVAVPLGTHTDIYKSSIMGGLKGSEKQKILKAYFEELFLENKRRIELSMTPIEKVLLLDEAKSGGTISQAASHIEDIRKAYSEKGWKFNFVVCMVQDAAKSGGSVDKAVRHLIANRTGKSHKIATRLPFIDVRHMLPVILSQDPNVRKKEADYQPWELLEVVENEKAKELFRQRLENTLDRIDWLGSYQKKEEV